MRFLRPRSLTGLMLIGFALVSIPLLIAVITAAAKVRRLSEQSTQLVQSGVATTHQTQQLFQQIASMERSVRVYQVLRDNTLLTVYRETRDRFVQTLSEIESPQIDARRGAQLQALRRLQQDIDEAILAGKPPTDSEMVAVLQRFSLLWDATGKLAEFTSAQIDSGLSKLQVATTETQAYLFSLSAGMILLTAALVALFTLRLMHPIRQIDSAISRLGKGTFSKPIAVSGPSDLVALGHQLEWLRSRLLELAQERNRFLRHMSHELKTPLAALREGTELLMDGAVGPLDSSQREVVAILRDNSIRLQQLIENLLSFSAWQARHTGLEITEFRLRPLVKSTLETHQLTALAQRVHLDLKVQDIELRADRAKLKLILDNLVSNALKYSPRGGSIYLHARAEKEQLILDVADTGPGIAQDERSAIFDAFYSGRAPIAGHLKGTGIGLSVVLEFVQAHGGSIDIMDNVFPGAHFRVRLPLAPSAEAVPA
ncbi:MAG: HAMP domain-containing histidine kinase [Candidatus Obscuribacterales bacterium]|nr:HAMP domain-containing histidine kinase [Steroidobacteraceae bacterium]